MTVTIEYFTDILCIWAWGGQVRIDQLGKELGNEVQLRYRFIPLFAAAQQRVHDQWDEKGGIKGFNCHLVNAAKQWDHVTLHPDVWLQAAPASSTGAHLMLKAVQLLEERGEISTQPDPAFTGRSCCMATLATALSRPMSGNCCTTRCTERPAGVENRSDFARVDADQYAEPPMVFQSRISPGVLKITRQENRPPCMDFLST